MSPYPKTVLITGCTAGGIGDALLEQFLKEGHQVFATVRTKEGQDLLQQPLVKQYPAQCIYLPLEVTNQESIEKCLEIFTAKSPGKLDILINNAGIGALPSL
jgi:NAD(P)-dependent dehydrogenase (short-subunit alcohol dehydrogenase family)